LLSPARTLKQVVVSKFGVEMGTDDRPSGNKIFGC